MRVQEAWCCAKCGAVLDAPSVRDPEVCWWCDVTESGQKKEPTYKEQK